MRNIKYKRVTNRFCAFLNYSKLVLIGSIFVSCSKFVQIPPPITGIAGSTVYSSDQSAAAAMTSMYDLMVGNNYGLSNGYNSVSLLAGLMADELTNYDVNDIPYPQFYSNALNSNDDAVFWPEIFQQIHTANAVLEGLSSSTGVTAAEKKQLTGEAKFMRAFLLFYAVNLFGDVPLVTTTDYQANNTISRTPEDLVYQQIIMDLLDAENELPSNFVDPTGNITTERVRPNKFTAAALLARVYLYTKNYVGADSAATVVINSPNFALVADLDSIFLANSNEAIWQMQPVRAGFNTFDGNVFVLTSPPGSGSNPVALSAQLLGAFDTTDFRFTHWIGSFNDSSSNQTYYFPHKYKNYLDDPAIPVTEYLMVLRLAEQYLIRAEAQTQMGVGNGVNGAVADLNVIRNRAGLSNYSGQMDPASLTQEILHERQLEYFTEWGQRWLDLKRTGTVNSVMSIVTPLKGGNWNPDWALMPIPLSDVKIDPNLTQNNGY